MHWSELRNQVNLDQMFAILICTKHFVSHGGGGPGMGPIACAKHLADFLPTHEIIKEFQDQKMEWVHIVLLPHGGALVFFQFHGCT